MIKCAGDSFRASRRSLLPYGIAVNGWKLDLSREQYPVRAGQRFAPQTGQMCLRRFSRANSWARSGMNLRQRLTGRKRSAHAVADYFSSSFIVIQCCGALTNLGRLGCLFCAGMSERGLDGLLARGSCIRHHANWAGISIRIADKLLMSMAMFLLLSIEHRDLVTPPPVPIPSPPPPPRSHVKFSG